MNSASTRELYNSAAPNWTRKQPVLLSDFTGRPPTLELCEPVVGLKVLDLGCGEGYCARRLRERGAAEVIGIDISEKMIAMARAGEQAEPLGIVYQIGTATDLSQFSNSSFDLVLAMFLFNYLNIEQTQQAMREVFRLLKLGGQFVFAVPHPAFPFFRKVQEPPFYFDVGDYSYTSGRNIKFPGKIWRRDGGALDVQFCHKTVSDYFEALHIAGFTQLPKLLELMVQPAHLEVDRPFFSPLGDTPLHMAVSIFK